VDKDQLVARCGVLVDNWNAIATIIDTNRDAEALDITPQEARARGIVIGNETYVGRRIIATNIQREMPTYIKYLSGSYRHITAIALDNTPVTALSALEEDFTLSFRVGNWLEQHIQALSSFALQGRGVFMCIPSMGQLNTALVYIPPEDFVFPLDTRDLQFAPLLGIRYSISVDQFKVWRVKYQWDAEACNKIIDANPEADRVQTMYPVYLMLMKTEAGVQAFWFHRESNQLLRTPYDYNAGFMNADGTAAVTRDYPIFPVYYQITENPKLIERKGRAHADMHDQEAMTMLWTSSVNASMRSSELYIGLDETGQTENPEITQTEFIMEPGKILKRPVKFYSPPAPDGSILATAQALRVENSAAAGQVDFAAQARKDSRKTATELDLAKTQTDATQAVSLTMFASGYRAAMQFQWLVLQFNLNSGFNTTFLADRPEIRDVLKTAKIYVTPAGDVDFVERETKLKLYTQYYQLVQGTALAPFFLQKMLELAFPKEYPQMAGLLSDNSKQMGTALLQIVENLPPAAIPPDQAAKLQEIITEAQKTFGMPGAQQNAPNTPPTA